MLLFLSVGVIKEASEIETGKEDAIICEDELGLISTNPRDEGKDEAHNCCLRLAISSFCCSIILLAFSSLFPNRPEYFCCSTRYALSLSSFSLITFKLEKAALAVISWFLSNE
jgi:hypothetical protein